MTVKLALVCFSDDCKVGFVSLSDLITVKLALFGLSDGCKVGFF